MRSGGCLDRAYGEAVTANGIDDVVAQLTAVVDEARAEPHRRGYFAALYLGMTRSVQAAIAAGQFDDSARMNRFAGAFASRYLDALSAYRAGGVLSRSL